MNFEPLTAEHVMRMGPLASVHAGYEVTPELAVSLEEIGGVAAISTDGSVLGIGGIAPRWEGVGLAWVWLSRKWRRHARAITHEVARQLEEADYRRVEIGVLCDFDAGHRWASRLGFEKEVDCARCWGSDGRDYSVYVRVKK